MSEGVERALNFVTIDPFSLDSKPSFHFGNNFRSFNQLHRQKLFRT